jgi:hypothetical protein
MTSNTKGALISKEITGVNLPLPPPCVYITTGRASLLVFGGRTIVIDTFIPLGPPGIVRFSISGDKNKRYYCYNGYIK